MSCNRQNIRPMGVNPRMNSCVNVCPAQGGIVTGTAGTGCGVAGAGCGAPCANVLLEELPLGMAYVPWQTFGTMYPMQQGLRRGTMFPCLEFDFMGRRCN